MLKQDLEAIDQQAAAWRPGAEGLAASSRRYEAIARLIANGEPPPWLVDALNCWGPTVLVARGADVFQGRTRKQMRASLERVVAAATVLVNALNDPPARGFLDAGANRKIDDTPGFARVLADLGARAKTALSWLVTEDGKTKAGRGKAFPPRYFPPRALCAAIVDEAWTLVRGTQPSPRNQKAAEAALLLWRASVEDAAMEPTQEALRRIAAEDGKHSWSEALTAWRSHFEEAREDHMAELRKEIRRRLVLAKRFAETPAED